MPGLLHGITLRNKGVERFPGEYLDWQAVMVGGRRCFHVHPEET